MLDTDPMPLNPPIRITKQLLERLTPLPTTAIQLLNLLADPNVHYRRLADLAQRDLAITSSLLRYANSSTFGLRGTIGTVPDAIRVVGTAETRTLVLASGINRVGLNDMPLYEFAPGVFTHHSELTANIAMTVANLTHFPNIGLAYACGLLHDIGKVLLNTLTITTTAAANTQPLTTGDNPSRTTLTEAETARFGISHAAIGRQLAELWHLPAPLTTAIGNHHDQPADQDPLHTCIYLANHLAAALDPTYPARTPLDTVPLPPAIDLARVCQAAQYCGLKAVIPPKPAAAAPPAAT